MSAHQTEINRRWIDRHLAVERWSGDEATVRCPLLDHTDRTASAGANAVKAAWNCHACNEGGKLSDLAVDVLGVDPPEYVDGAGTPPPQSTVYQYRNAKSAPVFEVLRRNGKQFFQRHTAPNGKEVWKVPAAGRGLPYRLPDLLRAVPDGKPVLIVEGEKDVDRLCGLGFTATCNAGGAGKWTAKHSKHLPARIDVVVIPDADGPGVAHAEKVITSLAKAGAAGSIRVVPPETLGFAVARVHGKDISDWLDADPSHDASAVQELIDNALDAAKWGPPRSSTPATSDDPRPIVEFEEGERERWTRDAIEKLVTTPQNDLEALYGNRVITADRTANDVGRKAGYIVYLYRAPGQDDNGPVRKPRDTLLMGPAPADVVASVIDRQIRWIKVSWEYHVDGTRKRRRVRPADASRKNAEEILTRYRLDSVDENRLRFRMLSGVIDGPTLRPDGTLLIDPGYDAITGLYADFDPSEWPEISENPTREDARRALLKLYDLVKESPFKTPVDRAVWVAFLLTIAARQYVGGNVPMFGFSANAPGVGKGTLTDLAAIVATGRSATKWAPVTAGRSQDAQAEERKRLMAVAMEGLRLVVVDNVPAGSPIGTPAMDMCITTGGDSSCGHIQDRVLGLSVTAKAPWTCVLAATGNNMMVKGDMGRRLVLCQLQTTHPDPEKIQYYHHPDPLKYALAHRKELLVAALTILLAHKRAVDAGEPDTVLRPKINSFGNWSDCIRSPVWWADPDGCDPWDGNTEVKANAQPEQQEALEFLAAWHSRFGSREVVVREIVQACEGTDEKSAAVAEAVDNLALPPARGKSAGINTRALGRWLSTHKDQPGDFIVHIGQRQKGMPVRWYVEEVRPQSAAEVAEQVIKDLLAALPDLTDDQRKQLRELHQEVMQPDRLSAIDEVYGPNIEQHLKKAFPQVYDGDGKPLPTPIDEWQKAGYTKEQAAKLQDLQGIESLATFAQMHLDAIRPVSPAFQQVRDRYSALQIRTMGRENRAFNYLNQAHRELGIGATVKDLVAKAIALGKDDAVSRVNGQPAKQVYESPPRPISHEEARRFEENLETDIRKLCELPAASRESAG